MSTRRNNAAKKTKVAELERVRNNQRRHRERKKEHIAHLEEKVRQYENASGQPIIALKLDQLTGENETLKRLLQSLGLGNEFLNAYINATQLAPSMSRSLLGGENYCQNKDFLANSLPLDVLQHRTTPATTREQEAQHASLSADIYNEDLARDSLQLFENLTPIDASLTWDPFDFPATSPSASQSLQTDIQTESLAHLARDSLMTEACNNTTLGEDASCTTTLCSVAFSLVSKNNLKGYSAVDLDMKLRVGYRFGAMPFEECRVDNKILFTVLAEIL